MSKIEQLRKEILDYILAERANFIRDGFYELEEWPEFTLDPDSYEGKDCYRYFQPSSKLPVGISIWFSEAQTPEIHYMFVVEGNSYDGRLPLEGGLLATIVALMVNEALAEKTDEKA